jgi:toxin ParE1/3/4
MTTYITEQAGPRIAHGYIQRIERACQALAIFPERGSRHDDVMPGLRAIGFERRATILFRVEPETVEIVMVAYGGRNWMSILRTDE